MKSKLLIAIAALVASVSISAGELDGKALICEDDATPNPSKSGFAFREGKVFYSLLQRGDNYEVVINEWELADSYQTDIDKITWRQSTDSVTTLDRKTLKIDFEWGEMSQAWECEIAASMEAYEQALEESRAATQERIDERMKDNKI